MKHAVILSIRGRQAYQEQDPDIIELVSEGTLEYRSGGWDLTYEESDLTGLAGVTTTFRLEGETVTLTRSGNLNAQMVFKPGFVHESLYCSEFGTMMMSVCATQVRYDLSEKGGTVDLKYNIEIEHAAAGTIDYHLKVRLK